ncbi:MAG: preprotein translocase subunit SecA, partial [Candidatus Marinimicrobia bacterium]|nr:preprotein translocase subunit SecA [Candidatus Neomarinimicrobiota bacterium]
MSIITFLTSIFGTASDREIKKIQPIVDEINQIYSTLQNVSIEKLRERTEEFKRFVQESRSAAGKELPEDIDRDERDKILLKAEREALDEILPEAFAMVKEIGHRLVGQEWIITDQKMTWDMVPYDVQLIGAVVLHEGKIAEMKTGEGKTLVATMPVYLNALTGR